MNDEIYIAYYESTIIEDEDDRESVISALNHPGFEARWYPVPIPKAYLFSTSNRLYAGELPDGTKVLFPS